ncbi:hypothetical protein CDL15_Pgr017103 [Punica granatum]|uniref:Gamma-glutamyltranspeptidase 1-like n=1 Tax=Punica granatum TaxID=22663 RepID=A0A218VYX4_PUNGR|nr:hypothetical protein CDL15_Pgr017103 [Punica granatum]
MLVRLSSGKTQAFDMRETAPSLASENMYGGNLTLKASGALSIAVPGELAGLHEAWRQYGKLPWKRLVSPAEHLARNGFKISPYLHMQMSTNEDGILADKGLREIFTSNGHLLGVGDICRNRRLAETLKKISQFGIGPLYNGSVGFNLVRDIRKLGGIISMDDLRSYRFEAREPTAASVLGLEILGMPPASSGGAAMILILNILSLYGFPSGISGSLGVHRTIEALKHAFAVKMNLGDPEYVNISAAFSDMMSVSFAKELKKTIYDNMTFSPGHYGGRWNQIHDHGTSHISVIDRECNAVSMTSTAISYFGA